MTNIAVFASGNGSNLGALIRAMESVAVHARFELVVSDNPEIYCLERARKARLSCFMFYPHMSPCKAV